MAYWNILFVDDETNVLNALRRTLRKSNYNLYFAPGPQEALELLEENHIDLLVSDYLMPDMDGLNFLQSVKELYPEIIRVLLTGHADIQIAIQAINQGEVARILTKPWNDDELKITLRHIFDYAKLRRENQILLDMVSKQKKLLEEIEKQHPGITFLKIEQEPLFLMRHDEDF
jgi:DNA-binding NtrC family response regulator